MNLTLCNWNWTDCKKTRYFPQSHLLLFRVKNDRISDSCNSEQIPWDFGERLELSENAISWNWLNCDVVLLESKVEHVINQLIVESRAWKCISCNNHFLFFHLPSAICPHKIVSPSQTFSLNSRISRTAAISQIIAIKEETLSERSKSLVRKRRESEGKAIVHAIEW